MSWKRIATFLGGGALVVAGTLIPAAGAVLIPAGVGLVGYGMRAPGDRKMIKAAAAHGVQPDGTRIRPNGDRVPPPASPPPTPKA
jgi:hypothetical protein